jgi:acyl carrier protein
MDEKLRAILTDRLPSNALFTEESAFEDLGLSSLSMFEVGLEIEDQYKLDGDGTIPDEDLYKDKTFMLRTVGDLQCYIDRRAVRS